MYVTCEVKAERLRHALVRRQWRFVAVQDAVVIAASPPFWSGAGAIVRTDRSDAALREVLTDLARRGWRPWGGNAAPARGAHWYSVRLYRA